jgi:hypothetical protein
MHIRCLLVASLFVSVCVAPVGAQSPPEKNLGASRTILEGPNSQRDSGLQIPRLTQSARASLRADEFNPSSQMDRLDSRGRSGALAENDAPCYTMRSYRFTRVDPKSDSLKFAGYSTCQPAPRVRLRDAEGVGSR